MAVAGFEGKKFKKSGSGPEPLPLAADSNGAATGRRRGGASFADGRSRSWWWLAACSLREGRVPTVEPAKVGGSPSCRYRLSLSLWACTAALPGCQLSPPGGHGGTAGTTAAVPGISLDSLHHGTADPIRQRCICQRISSNPASNPSARRPRSPRRHYMHPVAHVDDDRGGAQTASIRRHPCLVHASCSTR